MCAPCDYGRYDDVKCHELRRNKQPAECDYYAPTYDVMGGL
jgi:hypothetical protein